MRKNLLFKAAAVALALFAALGAGVAGVSVINAERLTSVAKTADEITVISPVQDSVLTLDSADVAEYFKDYQVGVGIKYYDRGKNELILMNPVKFEWDSSVGEYYQLYLADSLDFKNAEKFLTVEKSIVLQNLIPNKTYYWKVKVTDKNGAQKFSKAYRFETKGSVRAITIDGVSNARDLGGIKTVDGKTTKYGVIYRSANVDSVTEKGIKEVRRLGIKTDVDLRGAEAATVSPLKGDVNLIPFNGAYNVGHKAGVDGDIEYRRAFRDELKVFADEANYPVLFHCAIGRDRTGTLAGILLAICGVSREDIMRDWELSYLSERGTCDNVRVNLAAFQAMFDQIEAYYKGDNLSEKTIDYVKKLAVVSGDEQSQKDAITDEQIAAIKRNILG